MIHLKNSLLSNRKTFVMEKAARATLKFLFQEYVKGPIVLYTVNSVIQNLKENPIAVTDYMLEKNWIRERWVYDNQNVACRITVEGIEAINPLYVDTKLRELIGGLVIAGGKRSLADIFQNRIQEYSIALDIVYQLEKLGLILIIHQNGNIHIQLTDQGWKYVEKTGKSVFTLMAVA